MASGVKLEIVIPDNHQVELTLPPELPAGPADVLVVPRRSPKAERSGRAKKAESLADLFAGRVGVVESGGSESFSQDGGAKLADYLETKRKAGHL